MKGEKPYINIGTEKSCLFVLLSKRLIRILENNTFLYYSIEETLMCASKGYYAIGILTYSQIFNCFKIKTPNARHKIAHEFLKHKPSKNVYENLLEELKHITEVAYIEEADKFKGSREDFHKELFASWQKYINAQSPKLKQQNRT
jgi:hypothetical protein